MADSARVQRILAEVEELSPAEMEELAEKFRLKRELAAGQRYLDEVLAETGPIPQAEVDRLLREWPRA